MNTLIFTQTRTLAQLEEEPRDLQTRFTCPFSQLLSGIYLPSFGDSYRTPVFPQTSFYGPWNIHKSPRRREEEFSNEICSSAEDRFESQACKAAGNHRYCVNPANYSTAASQSDSAVLFLFIVTYKAHEVITLFLCLKNKKPLKEKPITWDGDGSEKKVKRPTEVVVLGQIQMPREEIRFQRASCRFKISRASSGKCTICPNGLSSSASWKETRRDCGWHLSKILHIMEKCLPPMQTHWLRKGPQGHCDILKLEGCSVWMVLMKTRYCGQRGLNLRARHPI